MLNMRTIQAKLVLGFALGPIILAIIGWVAYTNTIALVDSLNRQQHTYQVLQQAEIVSKLLVDAETGQRGFLLTGAERYLQPYTAAIAALGPSIARLGDLTADNPRQQARLPTLRELVRKKTDELAETTALRREKGPEAALAVVQTDRGKNVMDDIRTVADQFEAEENNLLAQRSAEAARTAQLTFNSITYGTLGSFVLLV
jgi:methyl-accepting chemotaxis protein